MRTGLKRMKGLIGALWAGEVPLARVFWGYAIAGGFVLNLATTILFVVLLSSEAPVPLSIAVFALPIPYNVFMLVSVWASAGTYQGSRLLADLARIAIVLWTLAASAL